MPSSRVVVLALTVLAAHGCGLSKSGSNAIHADPDTRIGAGASSRPGYACPPGKYELRIEPGRRALMLVTAGRGSAPRALLLALHGAGSGGAPGGLYAFRSAWNLPGLVIVAPSAAGNAWALSGGDVAFTERALQRAFARCRIDRRRVAIGGFSSGAWFALFLGLTNGDLFRSVIAMSAGGSLPERRVGTPHIFLAHGTNDTVIPISVGGDRLARELRGAGYAVTYRRFHGGHRPRQNIARAFVRSSLLR